MSGGFTQRFIPSVKGAPRPLSRALTREAARARPAKVPLAPAAALGGKTALRCLLLLRCRSGPGFGATIYANDSRTSAECLSENNVNPTT